MTTTAPTPTVALPEPLFAAKSGTATPLGVDAVRDALRADCVRAIKSRQAGGLDAFTEGRISGIRSALFLLGLMTSDESDAVYAATGPSVEKTSQPDDSKGGPFPDEFDDVAPGADARPFTEGGASC